MQELHFTVFQSSILVNYDVITCIKKINVTVAEDMRTQILKLQASRKVDCTFIMYGFIIICYMLNKM